MEKFKTWLERMESNQFNEWTQNIMLKEAPHTAFTGILPSELAFLNGRFVDMGFENLGFNQQQQNDLLRAFSGTGVVVPGTQYKLRFVYPNAVIEVIDGSEKAVLQNWWKEAVLVANDQAVPTWIGNRVRPDQVAGYDLTNYKNVGEGCISP